MCELLVKAFLTIELVCPKLIITFNFKNEPITAPTNDELETIEGSSEPEPLLHKTEHIRTAS